MTREFSFLLACLRSFFQPGATIPPAADLNWRRLIQLAERHAVLPLFCHSVRTSSDIPVEILTQVQSRALEAASFDLTLSAELARLLRLFDGHEIPVVALKGPVLGASLYGDTALRSSVDLDFLVHREDVVRSKQLLEGTGYRMQSILPWTADESCLLRRDSQMSFSRSATSQTELWVDLHWRLLPGYFPPVFEERGVWRNLTKVPLAGTFVRTLLPDHQLLFLCAHGTKHMWERLSWICDIARLLQVESRLDWPRVFTQARETGTSRMVVLGLLLASELLGVDPPSACVDYMQTEQTLGALRVVKKRLHDEILTPASAMESARFANHVFERRQHRIRFIFGIFFEPTEAEYQALKLPPTLHWLYYAFRPARLAAKHVLGPVI